VSDAASDLFTALADRYRLERELGAGGMATVYLAKDLKHDRDVAIKVLKPELTVVLGAERFMHEISTTAALQHPHILPLFDSGVAGGFLFYVMPFIEGETIRDRLMREKQLPIGDAIRIASEVASALDYAHRRGVIHRDIKPENVLLHDGSALVADFGIALAASKVGGGRMTETGMSLGTPHYMSPEQAMGERDIDARSDVYALGVVTYEMLLGEPPFTGPTAQSVVAKVMAEKPAPLRARRDRIPVYVEDAVLTALEKLPADRFAAAQRFADALQGKVSVEGFDAAHRRVESHVSARSWRSRSRDPVVLTLGVAALTASVATAWTATHTPAAMPAAPVSFVVTAKGAARPVYTETTWPAVVSPDGRTLAYAGATGPGTFQLYLRDIGQLEVRPVPGSENAAQPIFSPDSRWLAFQSQDGMLVKVQLDHGTLIALAPYGAGDGAAWLPTGEIILGGSFTYHGLTRVSDAGGTPTPLTRPDTGGGKQLWHLWPVALGGGHAMVFTLWNALEKSTSNTEPAVASIEDGIARPLGIRAARALGVAGDYLVYLQSDGIVKATPFDRRRLRASGKPVPLLDSIPMCRSCNGDAAISLSSSGALSYMRGTTRRRLVWVDRNRHREIVPVDPGALLAPRLSPDGSRVALEIGTKESSQIWIYQFATATLSPLTNTGDNASPDWTADGRFVEYLSNRGGAVALWRQPADFSGEATRVFATGSNLFSVARSSPDRSHIVFQRRARGTHDHLFWVSVGDTSVQHPFTEGPFGTSHARFSPSGRSVAYVSNESGREEVYVRPFPGPGARRQISVGGGSEPVWSADGRRLYYEVGNRLMEARLTAEPNVSVVARDSLFSAPFVGGQPNSANYDVSRDGRRVLILEPNDDQLELVVSLNWGAQLATRMEHP